MPSTDQRMTDLARHTGFVTAVKLDRGFGFITDDSDGRGIFFHVSDLCGLEFDTTLQERHVSFDLIDTDRRPRAFNVRGAE